MNELPNVLPLWPTPIGIYHLDIDNELLSNSFPDIPDNKINIIKSLFDEEPFASLKSKMKECVAHYTQTCDVGEMSFSSAYINRHGRGMTNTPHHHAHCRAFGVYYVKCQEGSGDILLQDPRGAIDWPANPIEWSNRGTKTASRSYTRLRPQPGLFLIVPAFVIHSVEANEHDEERLSLAIDLYDKELVRRIRER